MILVPSGLGGKPIPESLLIFVRVREEQLNIKTGEVPSNKRGFRGVFFSTPVLPAMGYSRLLGHPSRWGNFTYPCLNRCKIAKGASFAVDLF